MNQYIHVKKEQHIAVIEIDHAPANALSSQVIKELRKVINHVDNDFDVHAVIITGAGRFFIAGADIKEFIPALGSKKKAVEMANQGQLVCEEIEVMKKPVIAAINGACLGGGLEIALACHIRLVSEEAILGLPELNLGLIPAFGGTQRLTNLLGISEALELILTSHQLSANEAKELKLVKEVYKSSELLENAKELARKLTKKNSYQTIKRATQAIVSSSKKEIDGYKLERDLFAELFETKDANEGIYAFIEKRKAEFKHK